MLKDDRMHNATLEDECYSKRVFSEGPCIGEKAGNSQGVLLLGGMQFETDSESDTARIQS